MMANRKRLSLFLCAVAAPLATILLVNPAAAGGDAPTRSKHNYDTYCVQCHGVNRNGKGVNTPDMSVQPRDHSDPKGMGDIPDTELFKAIKEGGLSVNKSVLMPAWGNVLSDDEIHEMVEYLRTVCKCGSNK